MNDSQATAAPRQQWTRRTFAQPGGVVNHLYFTNNSFLGDGSIVLSSDHEGAPAFYRVDADRWHRLATSQDNAAQRHVAFRYSGVLAEDIDRLFWIDANAIHSAGAQHGEDHRVCDLRMRQAMGPGAAGVIDGPLSRLPGSDWVLFYVVVNRQHTVFGKVHAQTLEVRWGPRTPFLADHVQAMDTAGRRFLFARESAHLRGRWYHNASRVWTGDFDTGEIRAVYRHERRDGVGFEHIGHEMFDPSTGAVIAARYRSSPVGEPGIIRLREGRPPEMLWAGPAWHPCVSPCGRWVVTDTQPPDDEGISEIVLIDLNADASRTIGSAYTRGGHPYHPHPSFSGDGALVAYGDRQPGSTECRVQVVSLDK